MADSDVDDWRHSRWKWTTIDERSSQELNQLENTQPEIGGGEIFREFPSTISLLPMASRLLLRRISACYSRRTCALPPSVSGIKGLACLKLKAALLERGIHTKSELIHTVVENPSNSDSTETSPSSNHLDVPDSVEENSNLTYKALSSLKASTRHDLAMVFTCKVCETRSVKTANRESYEKGIVVARCGGCNNLHLIADRLGWFGEPGSIEDFLAARGEEIKKGSVDTLNLTLEELAGTRS